MKLFETVLNKERKKERNKAAVATMAALGAGLAVTVVGVACLTAFYCKTLMSVNYLEDGDVYED